VTQQQLEADNTGAVTEKTVEDMKQAAAHCIAEVAVIKVEMDGLRAKIFAPTK